MGQKIGGLIGDIIPLALFIYGALVVEGKIKTKKPLFKFPITTMRIIIYGGIIGFTALMIFNIVTNFIH
jgi:hypothetical protein